jgi:hypothetical protein
MTHIYIYIYPGASSPFSKVKDKVNKGLGSTAGTQFNGFAGTKVQVLVQKYTY